MVRRFRCESLCDRNIFTERFEANVVTYSGCGRARWRPICNGLMRSGPRATTTPLTFGAV